jgi:hypothetical protein
MIAKTWHVANSIRGRREKVITNANIWLVSDVEDFRCCSEFKVKVRENKYFDFNVTFYVNNEILEDVPTNDMENLTMINSINIIPMCDMFLL